MSCGAQKAQMLDEAQEIFVYDEASVAELKIQWERAKASEEANELSSRLAYAAALSRSPNRAESAKAIEMLADSLWQCEDAGCRAEVLMQLCMANYAIGNFGEARSWCSRLLEMYPDHQQVKDLFNAIVYKHQQQKESECITRWNEGLIEWLCG
jgi:hypothetical protein